VKTDAIIAPSLMQSMLRRSFPVLLLADALIAVPVMAEVMAEDKLIEFKIAKVSTSNGTRSLYRSTSDAKILRAAASAWPCVRCLGLKSIR
jgi:hypothetical protein